MTITTLVVIIHLAFPYELKINFEDMDTCLSAMDNFYFKFAKDVHSRLTLPIVHISCEPIA